MTRSKLPTEATDPTLAGGEAARRSSRAENPRPGSAGCVGAEEGRRLQPEQHDDLQPHTASEVTTPSSHPAAPARSCQPPGQRQSTRAGRVVVSASCRPAGQWQGRSAGGGGQAGQPGQAGQETVGAHAGQSGQCTSGAHGGHGATPSSVPQALPAVQASEETVTSASHQSMNRGHRGSPATGPASTLAEKAAAPDGRVTHQKAVYYVFVGPAGSARAPEVLIV